MIDRYQQQLIELYMRKCGDLNTSRSIYPSYYANMLEVGNAISNETGFLRLNIINQENKTLISNATITIYVTQGEARDIPIMHLITTLNPVRIELPIAYDLGIQIEGPVYDFSTYNLRVDAFGHYATNIYNIRLFPDTTTDFDVNMMPISQIVVEPSIEERIDIPSHPRDVVPGVSN